MNNELNWEEVCKIVREEQFECFVRSEENTKKYEKNGITLKCIYKSTKDCLEFYYPRLSPGGVILCDDYNSRTWPGVKKAVDEYFAVTEETIIQTTVNQCAIIKNCSDI